MRRRFSRLALGAALSMTVALSSSRGEAAVSVELKDGSSLRGELVEKVPGTKLVLQLATGEIRTLEWDAIARIDDAQHTPAHGPAPSQEPTLPKAPSHGNVAMVHLAADNPRATLQGRAGSLSVSFRGTALVGEGETWNDLCVTPCGTAVPKDMILRVGGAGITPSGTFTMPRDTKLEANTGALWVRQTGYWVLPLGVMSTLMGGLLLVWNPKDFEGEPRYTSLGWGLVGGGLGFTAGALAMILASGTTVRDDRAATIGRLRAPPRGLKLPTQFTF